MNEKNNQASNQENHQANQQGVQQNHSEDLQKTVVNGKVVSLKQAQQMEEQFNKQSNQTGIQAHHNNQSESVPAGQNAQNQNMNVQGQNQQQYVNQANVQSGQSHLEGMQGAELTQEQQMQQADHDAVQHSLDAKAKAKANKK